MGKLFTITPEPESLELKLKVIVGLHSIIAVTQAEASDPDFWDQEASVVGTLYPDDLGIKDVPTEPGEYVWEGTLKTWGPDMEGDYDAEYRGKWTKQ